MAYTASHGVGPRLPVVNRRVNPVDSGMYIIGNDIGAPDAYLDDARVSEYRLYERPLTDRNGTGITVRRNTNFQDILPTIQYPPQPGFFYVNPYLGSLYFHYSEIGNVMNITYTMMGSLVVAEDINWLYTHLNPLATPYSGEYSLEPGATAVIQKVYVLTVWEVFGSGISQTMTLNPAQVKVDVINPFDPTTLYSVITNQSVTDTRRFRFRAIPVKQPEK